MAIRISAHLRCNNSGHGCVRGMFRDHTADYLLEFCRIGTRTLVFPREKDKTRTNSEVRRALLARCAVMASFCRAHTRSAFSETSPHDFTSFPFFCATISPIVNGLFAGRHHSFLIPAHICRSLFHGHLLPLGIRAHVARAHMFSSFAMPRSFSPPSPPTCSICVNRSLSAHAAAARVFFSRFSTRAGAVKLHGADGPANVGQAHDQARPYH